MATNYMKIDTESVVFLLQGVFFTSCFVLLVQCFASAQTILLTGILWAMYPSVFPRIFLAAHNKQESTNILSEFRPAAYLKTEEDERTPRKVADYTLERLDQHYGNHLQGLADSMGEAVLTSGITNDTAKAESVALENPVEKLRCTVKENIGTDFAHDDKEGTSPSITSIPAASPIPNSTHRMGLRPLTLSLTNLPPREPRAASGSRRTVSLFNGAKRFSSVFYVCDENRDTSRSTIARLPADASRRVSLPQGGLLDAGTDLVAQLEEERKLTARLHCALDDMQDRARLHERELAESKQQVQDLKAAVESRDGIVRDLCLSMELFQRENTLLKDAAWREACHKIASETRADELAGKNVQLEAQMQTLLQVVRMVELGHRWTFGRFKEQARIEMERLMEVDKAMMRLVEEDLTETCATLEEPLADSMDKGGDCIDSVTGFVPKETTIANWFSRGSVSEPVMECSPHVHDAVAGSSPSTRTIEEPEFDEYASDDVSERAEDIELEFPTISPKLPPKYAAARARRLDATPTPGSVIYKVDGRVLAVAHNVRSFAGSSPFLDSAIIQCGPQMRPQLSAGHAHQSHNGCYGAGSPSPRQNPMHSPRRAAVESLSQDSGMRRDSPFYAIHTSAFVLPHPVGASPARCF